MLWTVSRHHQHPSHPSHPKANAEIKRLLHMANATYDPKALDALTRALVAQGFGR